MTAPAPSALRPLQQKEGVASERQPMPGVRLAAAVAAWIALSLAAGVATMIIGSEVAPGLATNTLAVIIVTEVYILLRIAAGRLRWMVRRGADLRPAGPATCCLGGCFPRRSAVSRGLGGLRP